MAAEAPNLKSIADCRHAEAPTRRRRGGDLCDPTLLVRHRVCESIRRRDLIRPCKRRAESGLSSFIQFKACPECRFDERGQLVGGVRIRGASRDFRKTSQLLMDTDDDFLIVVE
jgi:hypothetical protein